MQLDDEIIPVKPGMCVMIPPGVRHRAIGEMKVLNDQAKTRLSEFEKTPAVRMAEMISKSVLSKKRP